MEGQDVVTSDDHKIGTIVGEQDGFAIVEMGHVFKSKHALPLDFLHEFEGVQRATVDKDLVADSPKLDGGEIDANAVRMYYGLVEVTVVDPESEQLNADTLDGNRNLDRTGSESHSGRTRRASRINGLSSHVSIRNRRPPGTRTLRISRSTARWSSAWWSTCET